jgi:hypothetical protein
MTERCPVSEDELKYDGGGTMSEAEWTRRYNEALVKDRVVAQVWDVLCDIAPSDQIEIVRLLVSVGGERDFTAAGRLIFRHIFTDTDKIVSDEINTGE